MAPSLVLQWASLCPSSTCSSSLSSCPLCPVPLPFPACERWLLLLEFESFLAEQRDWFLFLFVSDFDRLPYRLDCPGLCAVAYRTLIPHGDRGTTWTTRSVGWTRPIWRPILEPLTPRIPTTPKVQKRKTFPGFPFRKKQHHVVMQHTCTNFLNSKTPYSIMFFFSSAAQQALPRFKNGRTSTLIILILLGQRSAFMLLNVTFYVFVFVLARSWMV